MENNKMESFKKLGIEMDILKSIEELGYEIPTEIQEKSIPHILAGKDVIGGSATGSGKTFAFGAGIVQNIQKGGGIKSLILAPTRELADQIAASIESFSKHKGLKIACIYGGVSFNPQIQAIRTADIIVGTPGRILDHIRRKQINFSRVEFAVLDEADRMLDMGFLDDVSEILKTCPTKRQTLLFTATVGPEIKKLSNKFMIDPVTVNVSTQVDPRKLKQVYYDIDKNMKFSLMVHLLKKEEAGLVMVFCNSRQQTDFVAKNLKKNGLDALGIHGGLTQNRRTQVLDRFNSKHAFILVCTDVAARGLDIPGVSHVYNYDIPNDPTQYVHRIGRTARAGEAGIAVSLLSQRDHDNFSNVLRINQVNVKKLEKPYIERVQISIDDDRGKKPMRRKETFGVTLNRDGSERTSGSRGGHGRSRDSSHYGKSNGSRTSGNRDSNRSGNSRPPRDSNRSGDSRISRSPENRGSGSRGSGNNYRGNFKDSNTRNNSGRPKSQQGSRSSYASRESSRSGNSGSSRSGSRRSRD